MSFSEFFIVAIAASIGYWMISTFIERRRSARHVGQEERRENVDDSSVPNEDLTWWEVLGIPSTASSDQIRAAYRSRMLLYHPDRVEGLGKEFRQLAEVKAKSLNAAYAHAKVARGFE